MLSAVPSFSQPRLRSTEVLRNEPREAATRNNKQEFATGVASSPRDRQAALRLVYENYVQRGMIAENPYRLRVTAFHLMPTTAIFIARERERVIATVTLIEDSPMGVPTDAVQPEVVDELRNRGCRVAEVSCLAFADIDRRHFLPVFTDMTRVMTQFAWARGVDQLLIGCVPRHASFYRRFHGFEQLGSVRPYSTVCNTLGVALHIDLKHLKWNRPDCYERYFGTPVSEHLLRAAPMTETERDVYSHVIDFEERPVLMDL
jgi:hypothetical protein